MAIHKLYVSSIEHIAWAKRLIISFYLTQDCFNPNIGGWEFSLEDCGYRNVCESDWIVMTPNAQHPLHSDIIKFAGNYTFVWDYGGVEGLNPIDFDAEHSYIVQLALVDTSCGYVDPCADTGYTTQFGEEPYGDLDTIGDAFNTYNNCGPGYMLVSDTNGCLFCTPYAPSEPTEPTEPSQPSGGGVSGAGGAGGGTGWQFSEPDVPSGGGGTSSGPTEPSGGDPSGFVFSFAPSDTPPVLVVTEGPEGPGGNPGHPIGGAPYGSPLHDTYSYELGSENATNGGGTYGPGSSIPGTLMRTYFGGQSPSVDLRRGRAARPHRLINQLVSKQNAWLNRRNTADQLNIDPHLISPSNKPDITNNNTPNTLDNRQPQRASTKAISAINIVNGKIYLRSNNRTRTRLDLNKVNQEPNQKLVEQNPTITRDRERAPTAGVAKGTTAPFRTIGDDINRGSVTPGSRSPGQILERVLSSIDYRKDSPDFVTAFNFGMKCRSQVRSGDSVFCEVYLTPIVRRSYLYTVSLFLRAGDKVEHILSSKTQRRTGSIKIAQRIPCKHKPGTISLIAVVYDEAGNIQGSKTQQVLVLDPSSGRGGAINVPSASLASTHNSIVRLINPSKSLVIPMGLPSYSVNMIVKPKAGSSTNVTLAAMLTDEGPAVNHAMTLNDGNSVRLRSSGKILINGIKPTGNYSTAIYGNFLRSSVPSSMILTIGSMEPISHRSVIHVGHDLTFDDIILTSNVFNATTRRYTFVFQTPFYLTEMEVFEAKAPNNVPVTAVGRPLTSNTAGVATLTSSGNRGSYFGLALRYPENLHISQRTVFFFRGTQ